MAVLFAVLLTYGRMSADSEIVAFKSSGISMLSLSWPALLLGALMSVASLHTSFELSPWGNRRFEVLLTELSSTKAGTTIKAGVFAEGFFNMVIYAAEVDSRSGLLSKIFIYDDSRSDSPLTIIAKKGQIIQDPDKPGHEVLLRLFDGNIHRKAKAHTKVNFSTFDLKLFDPVQIQTRDKSMQSLTRGELSARLLDPDLKAEDEILLNIESTKRWVISLACGIFALLGVALGASSNQRQKKVSGFILCIISVIAFWILYVAAEGFVRSSNQMHAHYLLWVPNLMFLGLGLWRFKRAWN
jgi:lipopolysaccharide export system permease protein